MDMTKFEAVYEPGFVAVAGELRRWVKELAQVENSTLLETETEVLERCRASQEAGARTPRQQVLSITQGGSEYNGPTTVSGGSVILGNYIGRDGGVF